MVESSQLVAGFDDERADGIGGRQPRSGATLTSMCLGVPGRVERVWEADGTRMGEVDFGGVHKEVCLAYVPEIEVGEYTIVHVGFALTRLDENSALETLELFRSIGVLEQEFADPLATNAAGQPKAAGPPEAAVASHGEEAGAERGTS